MLKKQLLALFAVLFLISSLSFGAEVPTGPIRIGLKYGNTAPEQATVTSKTGFELAYKNGDKLVTIHNLSAFTTLVGQQDFAHHIQLGPTYSSLEEMMATLKVLNGKQKGVFPVFDNGWKLFYGSYTTGAQAQSALDTVASVYQVQSAILAPAADYVKIVSSTDTEFVYASSESEFYLKPVGTDGVTKFNEKSYRGGIGFKRKSGAGLTVINYIVMDDYLYGVLPKEMSGDWPIEALKAQAVAARSYAMISFGKHSEYGFDICDTTDCQVYGGYGVEKPVSNQAVDETSGKLLKYNGQIVQTYYHSNSGGQTESIENIWSGSLPYIVGVYDPYSAGAPNTDWELVFTKKEIENILIGAGYSIGTLKDVRITEVSENGRVQELVFVGSSGSATFLKEKARALFGYTTLKSMWFELGNKPMVTAVSRGAYNRTDLSSAYFVTADGTSKSTVDSYTVTDGKSTTKLSFASDKIVFKGHGYGHGLGMSQWGAKAMAEQGFTYEDILTHYYKNTVVE